ncbi:MAG: hypothetical protein H6574_20015 [Lewinellaceae bacterium]|nr:hypothetical protein [Lewinellaceae bacterium]
MRKCILVTQGLLLGAVLAVAQPSNDNCTNPIPITDVTNYCSAVNAFTSVDATPSGYGPANCFGTAGNDVWFSFVPQFTDVTVIIRGATAQAPGGTLKTRRLPFIMVFAEGLSMRCNAKVRPITVISSKPVKAGCW